MSSANRVGVSVILPFADDEEVLGAAVRRIAQCLRSTGLGFEILAVDEDSGDNSHAVLAILRPQIPELRVIHAPTRGRGAETGVLRAQGKIVVVVGPRLAQLQLPAMLAAIDHVTDGSIDLEFLIGEFIVADRTRSLDAFHGVRLAGELTQRRLAKRLALRGFRVLVDGIPAPMVTPTTTQRRSWVDILVSSRRA